MNSTRRAEWLRQQIIEDVGLLNELFVIASSEEELRRVMWNAGDK